MSDPETFTEAEVNEAADLLLGVPKVGERAEAVPREAPSPDGWALAFVDLETTGLDPRMHAAWEVAIIRREPDLGPARASERTVTEWSTQLRLSADEMAAADEEALAVGHFYDRRWVGYMQADPQTAVEKILELTEHAILIGQNPGFDVGFLLEMLMLPPGVQPPWHYRPICVTTLAAGRVGDAMVPWNSRDIAEAVGIDVGKFEKHTALGDARLAQAIYDAVMG